MKTSSIIISAAIIICSFTSCKTKSNVVLSDFTKELIALFINESDDDYYSVRANDKKYEIIISTFTDTSEYYLRIHFNGNKSYKCWRNDFVGKTSYLGQRVMVYGNVESVFYTVEQELKPQKPCRKVEYPRYSPTTWGVILNKDLSFNSPIAYGVEGNDISLIENLASKYFVINEDDD